MKIIRRLQKFLLTPDPLRFLTYAMLCAGGCAGIAINSVITWQISANATLASMFLTGFALVFGVAAAVSFEVEATNG